jgi:pimeloyl-ACP methyl ester carboxylesterase
MVKLTKILTLIMLSCLPAIGLAATAQPASVQKIVVFVPGFFNSFAPEYFSYDIVKTMQTKLNPIGTIQDNGERVYQLFQNIRAQNPKAEINVIGHSAGGLYALYAINKGAHYIKNLITVSTPFNGVEFVENWRENSWAFSELMRWSYLDGLRQLTTPFVQNFLKTVRVPPSLRIMAYGCVKRNRSVYNRRIRWNCQFSISPHDHLHYDDTKNSFKSPYRSHILYPTRTLGTGT